MPELHFKHYAVSEAQLPGEVLAILADLPIDELIFCADTEYNVFNADHTDSRIVSALTESHWLEREEWLSRRSG